MADGTATPSAVALAVSFANHSTAPSAEHLWDVSTYAGDGSPLLDTGTIGGIDLPFFDGSSTVINGAIETNAFRNGTSPTPVPVTDWSMLWVGELPIDGLPMGNLVSEKNTFAGVGIGTVQVPVVHTDNTPGGGDTGEPPLKLAVTWMALVRAGEILTLYREGADPFVADTTLGVAPMTGDGSFSLGYVQAGVVDGTNANLRGGALWESALTEPQLIDAASWFGAAHIAIGEDAHVDGDVFLDTIALVVRVADADVPITEDFTGTNGDPWDPAIWTVVPCSDGEIIDVQAGRGRMSIGDIPDDYACAQADFTVPLRQHLDAYAEVTIPNVANTDEIDLIIRGTGTVIRPSWGSWHPNGFGVVGTELVSFADGDTVKIHLLQDDNDVELYLWITGPQPVTPTFAWTATGSTPYTNLYLGSDDGQPTEVFWDNISISSYDLLAVVTGEDNGGGGGGTSEGGMPFFTNQGHRRPSHRVR